MTDESALLAAIRAAVDDDAPRLVYADWLDEHGHPERAEFIRVQCQLAHTDDPALRRREAELLAAHHDAFAGPLAAPHLRFRFDRGFIIGFGHTGVFHQPLEGRLGIRLNDYLQFRPDGRVVTCLTAARPGDAVRLLRDRHMPAGNYRLDGVGDPVRIGFSLTTARQTLQYDGIVEPARIRFSVHNRTKDTRTAHYYLHVSIPGFDSFPET